MERGDSKAVDPLVAAYIESDPYHPGADDVRIKGTGVPVWALVAHLRVSGETEEETADNYCVPVDAVRAALAYYRANQCVIDARIAANIA